MCSVHLRAVGKHMKRSGGGCILEGGGERGTGERKVPVRVPFLLPLSVIAPKHSISAG